METYRWDPVCRRPENLVWPVRIDREGGGGPTPAMVRGKGWRRCGPGLYVPSSVDDGVVEQRIIEQAGRLGPHGAVGSWAALRWYGGNFFDGMDQGGRRRLAVPLVSGSDLRPDPRVALSWEQLAPSERLVVAGLPCTTVQRSLFDDMRRTGGLWQAVRSMDMAAAACLISVRLMWLYVLRRPAWTQVPLVRRALMLSSDESRSPQETTMRLVWMLVAGLPQPLCNRAVFDPDGRFIGKPDLFDPAAGLVGEYDGADHLRDDRRRSDTSREEMFRDHGLEYLRVVRGEFASVDRVAARMCRVRARAPFTAEDRRRWTLEAPPGYPVGESLDARLERLGLVEALTHT
jgi:hypothetical protein